ncbi:MAG TPA: amidohydrolase family protein [bacterium]|nr:amidohydrolase family protein [bacterium]HPN36216.1 amidohydrolase family protein [bacterium]
MKIRIENATLVMADGCRKSDLEITDERISSIGRSSGGNAPDRIIDAAGRYLLAGFIDVHSNGIAGFDFTNGWFRDSNFSQSEKDYCKGLETAAQAYADCGVTRVLLTSLAAPLEKLRTGLRWYASWRSSDQASYVAKNILAGVYVEGTFIKEEAFRGAHNSAYFNQPSIELFQDLQECARGQIRVVNVAPEWGQAALTLIAHLSRNQVIAAAGHTGSDGDAFRAAVDQGVRLAVHLFNGPTVGSFKPFFHGGALEAILRSPEVTAELIVDGYHVDPSYVLDALVRKGQDRIVAITDSMFATRMKDLTEFSILGVDGKVSEDGRYLEVKGRKNTLCGSVLTMDQAFSNLLTWFTRDREGIWYQNHAALSLEAALTKASALCSRNPASLLGLAQTGAIVEGNLADLVIAEIIGPKPEYQLKVKKVFLRGREIV